MNAYKLLYAGGLLATGLMAGPVKAEVVVVMSSKASTASLTQTQVSQIFLTKSNALPDGGKAVAIDQQEGAPVREEFYQKVTGRDAAQLKSYWSQLMFTGKAQRPKHVSGDAAVKAAVAATPGAIGYIDAGAADASVKVVLKP